MDYDTFKKLAIKGRWLWRKHIEEDDDYGDDISDILTKLCLGDRNMNYTLVMLWVCNNRSEIYKWSVDTLYAVVKARR